MTPRRKQSEISEWPKPPARTTGEFWVDENGPMRHVGPPMLCVAAAFAMAHSVESIGATYSVLAHRRGPFVLQIWVDYQNYNLGATPKVGR
jgi:hypothetical protein